MICVAADALGNLMRVMLGCGPVVMHDAGRRNSKR